MVKPYYDRIIRINTDSMLLKGLEIPNDIKISDEIGAFKIEYKGYIKYHVLNRKPILIQKLFIYLFLFSYFLISSGKSIINCVLAIHVLFGFPANFTR